MQKVLVIKIGGNIIDNSDAQDLFLQKFAELKLPKILIHGGGKLATELAAIMHIPQTMIEGRRITDAATLKVVTMVYAGFINKNIVSKLQAQNCNALGLCGADANLIRANKRTVKDIDYGFAGDITEDGINTMFLKILLENEIIPVISPITHNGKGQLLNTNADSIAGAFAKALSALYDVHLIYCFDKKGVLTNVDDENSVIKNITNNNIDLLKKDKVISAGMIPKIENALQAVAFGVRKVTIGHARELEDIVTGNAGTTIH